MKFPQSIQNLIDHFSILPTVGPKTAERYVFYLLKQNSEDLYKFAQSLIELKEKTTLCKSCFSISENNPCLICSDNKRDRNLLCVISDTRDLAAIESTRQYNGLYYVLGGVLNAIEGVKPEHLNINQMTNFLKQRNIQEVILALNPNIEGETTALYLTRLIKSSFQNINITRLAKGLPMGADIEYADELTISNALKYRNRV